MVDRKAVHLVEKKVVHWVASMVDRKAVHLVEKTVDPKEPY